MAALRAVLILIAILAFFLVGTPLQWLVGRRAPQLAHVIPRLFCRTLLRLSKVRLAVSGAEASGRPTLAVANHVSWIDILALGAQAPYCFLAKSDVARWPIVAAFADVQGTVFVDRRRRRSIVPANRQMAARMLANRVVLLFPEGTTFAGPEPGPFRSSHLAAARDALAASTESMTVDILPVAISYSSGTAAWVGDEALLPHLWRVLRESPIRCNLAFGAPIAYTAASDRKVIARVARAAVVDLLETQAEVAAATQVVAAAGAPARAEMGRVQATGSA